MSEFYGDSGEYEFLTQGIELSKDVDGLCLEIGTRLGLSAKTIMDAMREYSPNKIMCCVDPYGSIEYEGREGQICRLDYDNPMKRSCLMNLWSDVYDNPIEFKFFDMTDVQFFSRFGDGVPAYDLEERILDKYSFVFFDGPHSIAHIMEEMAFFIYRTNVGGIWIFDDTTPDFYDHSVIHAWLLDNGFELVKQGIKKAIYRKALLP